MVAPPPDHNHLQPVELIVFINTCIECARNLVTEGPVLLGNMTVHGFSLTEVSIRMGLMLA